MGILKSSWEGIWARLLPYSLHFCHTHLAFTFQLALAPLPQLLDDIDQFSLRRFLN